MNEQPLEQATQGTLIESESYFTTTDPEQSSGPVEVYTPQPNGQFKNQLESGADVVDYEAHESEMSHDERVTISEDAAVRNLAEKRKRDGFTSETRGAQSAREESAAERGMSTEQAIGQAATNATNFEYIARQFFNEWRKLKAAELPDEVDPDKHLPTFEEFERGYFDSKDADKIRRKLYHQARNIKQRYDIAS